MSKDDDDTFANALAILLRGRTVTEIALALARALTYRDALHVSRLLSDLAADAQHRADFQRRAKRGARFPAFDEPVILSDPPEVFTEDE